MNASKKLNLFIQYSPFTRGDWTADVTKTYAEVVVDDQAILRTDGIPDEHDLANITLAASAPKLLQIASDVRGVIMDIISNTDDPIARQEAWEWWQDIGQRLGLDMCESCWFVDIDVHRNNSVVSLGFDALCDNCIKKELTEEDLIVCHEPHGETTYHIPEEYYA